MRAVSLPMHADLSCSAPSAEQVRRFFDLVRDPESRPVYFHCRRGCDRTGAMAALYRIEFDGWSNADAVREMQQFGYASYYVDLASFVWAYAPQGLAAAASTPSAP